MFAIFQSDSNVVKASCSNGLIIGHAYTITRVKFCQIKKKQELEYTPLIRIRNPWGNVDEWNGPWSDQSSEWQNIPKEEKEEMGLTFDSDGEFWMSYKVWIRVDEDKKRIILSSYTIE